MKIIYLATKGKHPNAHEKFYVYKIGKKKSI
jgi:hypothetical protein